MSIRRIPFICKDKEYFDLPCSPYPASGEVTIQGEIHPPTKVGSVTDNGDDDYIVYNRCLVFTKAVGKPALTLAKEFNSYGKARRLGSVPPIFSNWCDRAMFGDDSPRLVGISYEGVPNGKDAKNFPTESGRMAVLISGAASVVVDKRFLVDPNTKREPTFGDYLEWIPTDSGGRIRPGAEKYGTCIVRVVQREQLVVKKADKAVPTLSKMKAAQSIPGYHELNPEEQSFLDGVVTSAAMEMDSSVKTSARIASVDIDYGAIEPFDNVDAARTAVYNFDEIPVQNDRIFGVFLEQVHGTSEVRVLLRPHGVC